MTRPQYGVSNAVPVVGTVMGRGASLARRFLTALTGAVVIGGLVAPLMPLGLTWPWLVATSGLVLVSAFVAGLRRDLRSVGQLGVSYSPARRLVLRGSWTTREHDLTEVVAVQVWCECGAGPHNTAPHRDNMEVFLRDGQSVRVASGTVFPQEVAMTLSELLASSGIKVVDWGEVNVVAS